MKINDIKFENAVWTPDCAGKQDLDFPVLGVSTRYWADHTARPHIYLGDKVIAELPKGEYIEGKSEAECKLKTEEWIKENLAKILANITL
ncbi:hypothetical protein [Bacillus toyonensis]|uniref:hypothetical protein n=1 Tax=Bacillus toyonensis TaxID=155322 RepID=UPI001155E077|nr:hypothetical protein [Bacillus toyonensis]